PDGKYTVLAGAYEFAPADRLPKGAIRIPTPSHAVAPPGTVCYLPAEPALSQRFAAFDDLVHSADTYVARLHDRFKRAYHVLERNGSTAADFVAAAKQDG